MIMFEKVSEKQYIEDCEKYYGEMAEDAIKKYEQVIVPKRSTTGSAGHDIYTPVDIRLHPGETCMILTGIRCQIDTDKVLMIYPRSSVGMKGIMLANTVGIIDSDYYNAKNEGHIMLKLVNTGRDTLEFKAGDRIVQGIFTKYYMADNDNVKTERVGGMGSTN